jgi:tetratricopeptide (TPR) repeat protein
VTIPLLSPERTLAMTGRHLAVALLIVAATTGAGAWYFTTRADPDALFQQAESHVRAGHWEAAHADARRLERLRKPTPRDRLLRAGIASSAGDDARALRELQEIHDDNEHGAQALYLTGLIERRRQRLRYAEAAYREAVRRDPNLIKARKELLYILGMQFRRREVDAEFKALARITPLNPYDLYVWGLTHYVTWGPDSATNLQGFIDADPDDRYSRLALATLLLTQPGEDARVEQVLSPLPQDDPEVVALKAEHELRRGLIEEASRLIAGTRADDARLARLRGRIALARGDRASAVRHYRQALGDEPYDRVSNADLGKALLLEGDQAGAAPYLARARQLDEVYNLITAIRKVGRSDSSADPIKIAKACEVAGLLDEARGWFLIAVAKDPLDVEAQRGLHRIQSATPANPARDAGS